MPTSSRRVAIVGGVRIPFARANTAYNEATNQQMLTAALKSLVSRFNLEGQKIGEVAAGAVIKPSRDWTLARESALGSGLHPETPAYDVQRACGTSLTAAVQVAHRIAAGGGECGIAGGGGAGGGTPPPRRGRAGAPPAWGGARRRAAPRAASTRRATSRSPTARSCRRSSSRARTGAPPENAFPPGWA